MLKDIILKNFNSKSKKRNFEEELMIPIRGSLKITSTNVRTGELEHVDEDHNTVMIWARHAMMHMITGSSFSGHGIRRLYDGEGGVFGTGATFPYYGNTSDHGAANNPDGTLISGNPYFTANGSIYDIENMWTKSTITPSLSQNDPQTAVDINALSMPFFPTKMLFGTGIEYESWSAVPTGYKAIYESDGWSESGTGGKTSFNGRISENANKLYSNKFTSSIIPTRTMNDIYSQKIDGDPLNTDFGVAGAIKNGLYFAKSNESTKTELVSGKRYLKQEYQGVGLPCFVYATRTVRPSGTNPEIDLGYDNIDNYENKITYSVTLPAQTDAEFYPYNGYILKQVGLFCDARLVFNNTAGSTQSEKMPAGTLFAKRNISPITKSHENEIVAQWTLYF